MTIIWQWHESDPEKGNLTPPQRVFDRCWFWFDSDDSTPEWMPTLWGHEDEWREKDSYGDSCVMRYYPAPQEEAAP